MGVVADQRPGRGQALEAPRGAHAAPERALGRALDDGPVGKRVGEREPELDHVRAGLDRSLRELRRLGLRTR